MAFNDNLKKAKSASQHFKKDIIATNEDKKTDFKDIRNIRQQIKTLKSHLKEQKIETNWENPEEYHQSINQSHQDLDQVLCLKESLLNILRNSEAKSDNSLCLKREVQAELIETFQDLIKIVESKHTHIANLTWISNQNWTCIGQDLEQTNWKILHIEALLSKNLQEIKNIEQ